MSETINIDVAQADGWKLVEVTEDKLITATKSFEVCLSDSEPDKTMVGHYVKTMSGFEHTNVDGENLYVRGDATISLTNGLFVLNPIMKSGAITPSWTPVELFLAGEQGAYFDPSDLTTLFQGSTGLIPVTSDGDPVGLMLDKSQGGAGNELIVNGTFDDGVNNWTNGGSQSFPPIVEVTNNELNITCVIGAYRTASQSFTTVVGKTYQVTCDGVSKTSGAFIIIKSDDLVLSVNIETVTSSSANTATLSGLFVATSTTTYIHMSGGISGVTIVYDNISVKALPGNHATQSISASRFLYKTDDTLHWLYDDQVDDSMGITLPSIASATVAIATDESVEITTSVDLSSGSYTLGFDSTLGQGYGVVIVDRDLTTAETASLTAYLNDKRGA